MTEGNKPARPWDLFNKKIEHVTESIAKDRLDICKECPMYIKSTHQCKECGCIMNLKVKLPHAQCPLDKWVAYNPELKINEFKEDEL